MPSSHLKPEQGCPIVAPESSSHHLSSKEEEGGKKWSLDDFVIGKKLGAGQFGTLHLAKTKKEGFIVAIKAMKKDNAAETRFKAEIMIQSHLRHPNILQVYEYFYDDYTVYTVLECAPYGDLSKKLRLEERFTEAVAAGYMYQVCDALGYCHELGIIHRDIKPQNLLLGQGHNLKIADFGCAVMAKSGHRKNACGTMDYIPPEMCLKKPYDPTPVDLWMAGVLCFEFLAGKPPFAHESTRQTRQRIIDVSYEFPDHVTESGRDFIRCFLVRKAAKRLAMRLALRHDWLQKRSETESL